MSASDARDQGAGHTPAPLPDAVTPDPGASYERAAAAPEVDAHGRAVVSEQLGRPARGDVAVVHRCGFGLPTVVRVSPRLGDGTPFPTVFWLSCPVMRSRVGRLEADHAMVGLNDRLARDDEFAAAYEAAAERYVDFRDSLGDPLPGDPTAGGMPDRVKCLHVHAAHTLATGDNPVGRWTVEQTTPAPCPEPCVDVTTVSPEEGEP
ncbi:MAG: DUF501 domain-containing protein [Nitriliruptorales bacterium]|nr:DUF501 domain-containing protein [Nitriliruptorales bacterium]